MGRGKTGRLHLNLIINDDRCVGALARELGRKGGPRRLYASFESERKDFPCELDRVHRSRNERITRRCLTPSF